MHPLSISSTYQVSLQIRIHCIMEVANGTFVFYWIRFGLVGICYIILHMYVDKIWRMLGKLFKMFDHVVALAVLT